VNLPEVRPSLAAQKKAIAWWSSYGLLLFVTLIKPFSNVFLAWGMRRFPEAMVANPGLFFNAMLEPFVAIGIVMQVLWLLTRMSLLSIADLSFVLPVTSAGYVISTLLGALVLHEPVSAARWAGAVLISLGAALVVSTPEQTTVRQNTPAKAGGAR
jgi:uncharacterized membrane protein